MNRYEKMVNIMDMKEAKIKAEIIKAELEILVHCIKNVNDLDLSKEEIINHLADLRNFISAYMV